MTVEIYFWVKFFFFGEGDSRDMVSMLTESVAMAMLLEEQGRIALASKFGFFFYYTPCLLL